MCGRIDCYIDAFRRLETGTDQTFAGELTYGCSPLQPLLLLTVLDLIGSQEIQRNFISPSEELEKTFQQYLIILPVADGVPGIAPTFLQLGRYPFWELRPKPDMELVPLVRINNLKMLEKYYYGAKLADELYPLLVMEAYRKRLCSALVDTYFSPLLHSNIREAMKNI